MNSKRLTINLTVAGLLATAACGDETMELGSRYLKSETISASSGGGFVVTESDSAEFAGVGIDVPAGALSQQTTITVAPTDDLPIVDDVRWVGPAMDFGPDGAQFATPVTITLRVNSDLGEDDPVVRVVSADGVAEWVEGASIDVNADGTWSFLTDHFTRFQPGARPSAPQSSACTTDADCVAGEFCSAAGTCAPSRAEVTGGSTSVLLDLVALSAAGLDLSGISDEVIAPGDLGPDSVAFPINPRTSAAFGIQPTTFVYDFVSFAPISGAIEHDGELFFDQQFGSGDFSIGFDAARATGNKSGFFVESTTEGFLQIAGVFFDVETPSLVDAQTSSLVIEANLLVAPELAAFLNDPALEGADVGDARIDATAQLFSGGGNGGIGTIREVAEAAGVFNTLLQTVSGLDINGILDLPAELTAFAPTDAAFSALPVDLTQVDQNIVQNIILAHLVAEELDEAALTAAGSVTSIANVTHEFANGAVRGASVATTDVDASNGIIHILDDVIIPPTTLELLVERRFTELASAVSAASAATQSAIDPDTLGGAAPVTVFAPTNDAFRDANLAGEDLDAVLGAHVVAGQLTSADFAPGRVLTTVTGSQLTVGLEGRPWSLTDERGNTISVIFQDQRSLSGAVHTIDGVLLPARAP